jgi:4'-phosphopantetheinyl transferase
MSHTSWPGLRVAEPPLARAGRDDDADVQRQPVAVMLTRLDRPLEPATLERLLALLDPARRRQLRRYRHVADIERGAVADVLARTLVGLLARRLPRGVSIARTPSGRPYVVGDASPEISLAHSGRCVICAASPMSVGIDVELLRPLSEAMTRELLGPAVRDGGSSLPEPERSRRALRLWTAKEAYLKLTGSGLAIDPRTLQVGDRGDRSIVCGPAPHPPGVVTTLALDPAYAVALCTRIAPATCLSTISAEQLIRAYLTDTNAHLTRSLM